jgi:glycosyltransferase involved in cell wall biosynthesis
MAGRVGPAAPVAVSVLVPVKDEVDNVGPLHEEIGRVLGPLAIPYEIIFVDDGSTDGTTARLKAIRAADPGHVHLIVLRRNFGQTAALSAALDRATGSVLIPIDGDLQNDPADIPRLLAELEAGFDVVSGWRRDRKDYLLTRKVPSWIANGLVARLSGVPIHDFGCTLKAYRREVLEGVRLYGEMHRFIPIFASWQGARVGELVVNHRPRKAGKTKYGLGRTFNVVLDLVLIRFYRRYAQRPIHFFGRIGLWAFALAALSFVLMLYYKYIFPFPFPMTAEQWPPKTFIETPLPVLAVMFSLAGLQSVLTGLVAEMVMRTYYESQDKPTYVVAEDLGE